MKTLLTLLSVLLSTTALAICDGHNENFDLTDPTDNQPWKVSSRAYEPPVIGDSKNPVVFILPPITGGNELDQSLALRFCTNGLRTYLLNIIKERPSIEEAYDFNAHNENLLRARAATTAIIDRLSQIPSVRPNFAILGSSQGGIQAAYLAGVEPRIRATVILAGAGNVPEILAQSDQEAVARQRGVREAFLASYGVITPGDVPAYTSVIASYIKEDPLNVAASIPADSSLLFVLLRDTTVPTPFQQELRAKIPQPRVIELDATHVPGIVEAGTVHAQEITEFLLEKLD